MASRGTRWQWFHDPNRDGGGCTWCGRWAQVNEDNLCTGCFYEEQREAS